MGKGGLIRRNKGQILPGRGGWPEGLLALYGECLGGDDSLEGRLLFFGDSLLTVFLTSVLTGLLAGVGLVLDLGKDTSKNKSMKSVYSSQQETERSKIQNVNMDKYVCRTKDNAYQNNIYIYICSKTIDHTSFPYFIMVRIAG